MYGRNKGLTKAKQSSGDSGTVVHLFYFFSLVCLAVSLQLSSFSSSSVPFSFYSLAPFLYSLFPPIFFFSVLTPLVFSVLPLLLSYLFSSLSLLLCKRNNSFVIQAEFMRGLPPPLVAIEYLSRYRLPPLCSNSY